MVSALQKMPTVGQPPLPSSIVQPTLSGMIESLAPGVLCAGCGGFTVTRECSVGRFWGIIGQNPSV